MTENLRKNVRILTCNACKTQHVIEKDIGEFAFTCEGCENDIFVDNSGNQIVIGNLNKPVEKPNKTQTDPLEINKINRKPDEEKIDHPGPEEKEKNQFLLMPE